MYILTNNAEEISKELFRLSVPTDNTDSCMFGVLTKGDESALQIDLDADILIHPLKNTEYLKTLIDYTETQKEQLDAYLDTVQVEQTEPEPLSGYVLGRFPFRNIVEGFTDIKDKDWMIENGWITIEEEI
jgi:hypothetical protein